MNFVKKTLNKIFFSFALFAFPIKKTGEKSTVGITTLLCHYYVDWFIYAVSSFFYYSGLVLPLFIVDDGTLTQKDKEKLQHFFTVTFLDAESADKKMAQLLKKHRSFFEYRLSQETSIIKRRFDAYFLAPFERVIHLDSDSLFFKKPNEVINWIFSSEQRHFHITHEKIHWRKPDLEHSFRTLLIKYLDTEAESGFNSGLIGFTESRLDTLKKLNRVFQLFKQLNYDLLFQAEECALSFVLQGSKELPKKKYQPFPFMQDYVDHFGEQTIFAHYCCESKPKFIPDAVRLVVRTRFFRS